MSNSVRRAQTHLARCISAEFRARMAAQRLSGQALAAKVGVSQNYLAKRLRDEASFTLDDVESVVEQLDAGGAVATFLAAAIERNSEEVRLQMGAPAADQ